MSTISKIIHLVQCEVCGEEAPITSSGSTVTLAEHAAITDYGWQRFSGLGESSRHTWHACEKCYESQEFHTALPAMKLLVESGVEPHRAWMIVNTLIRHGMIE